MPSGPVPEVVAEAVMQPGMPFERTVRCSTGAPPVSPAAPFRLGSLSKVVTASALLSLASDGKVDLGAPLRDYIDVRGDRWEVRVGDLPGHSSGVGLLARRRDVLNPGAIYGLRGAPFLRTRGPTVLRQAFEPGTAWSYGHVSASLTEQVIAACVDAPFADWMNGHFLPSCGMTSSAFGRPPPGCPPVPGTALIAGRIWRLPNVVAASDGACGLWASLDDLTAYAGSIATGGSPGLADAVRRAHLETGLPRRPDCPFATAGLRTSYRAGHEYVLHGGNWWGYSAAMLIDRCCERAAVCLTSGQCVGAAALRCWESLRVTPGHRPASKAVVRGSWEFRGRSPHTPLRLVIDAHGADGARARWRWGAGPERFAPLERDARNPPGHCFTRADSGRSEFMVTATEQGMVAWAALSRWRFPAIAELRLVRGNPERLAALTGRDGQEDD